MIQENKEGGEIRFQGIGDCGQRFEGGLRLASLDLSDVIDRQVAAFSDPCLGEVSLLTQLLNLLPNRP